MLETFAGTPQADAATVEVLRLAQGLEIGPTAMAGVLHVRGMHLGRDSRLTEAVFHMREAVRLAEEADRPDLAALYLTNLGSALMGYDPATSADTTRRALDLSRRGGNRRGAAVCVTNLAQVLIDTGRWDEAAELLAPGGDADVASDASELAAWARLVLVALRGDSAAARSILARFEMLPNSDDPEDQSALAIGEAMTAAAEHDPDAALEHSLRALSFVGALGVSHEALRWGWPVATRIALDRDDADTIDSLLVMLPVELPRLVPPMLRAERLLVLARRAAAEGSDDAGATFESAVTAMREMSPPHLLAQGLLDHAEFLAAHADPAGAAAAADEARAIGERLGCRPVVARAEAAGACDATPMSAGGH
jgi:hypothetical protein